MTTADYPTVTTRFEKLMVHGYNSSHLSHEDSFVRIRELYQEIAEHQERIRELEAQLPLEEQFQLNLERLIKAKFPEASDKVHVEIVRLRRN